MTMTTCNTPARTHVTQQTSMVRTVFTLIAQIIDTHSQRRALRTLDCDALNDLGLTYAEANREATRPFWDVPATWRR